MPKMSLYLEQAVRSPKLRTVYRTLDQNFYQIMWDEYHHCRTALGESVVAILKCAQKHQNGSFSMRKYLTKKYLPLPQRCNQPQMIEAVQNNDMVDTWRKRMKTVIRHIGISLKIFKHQIRLYNNKVGIGFIQCDQKTMLHIEHDRLANHPPRIQLKQLGMDYRYHFQATYGKCGFVSAYGHYAPTIMLINIKYHQSYVAQHIWIPYSEHLAELGTLQQGDQISFDARVCRYRKKHHYDYSLSYLTHVKMLKPKDHKSYKLPTGKGMNAILSGMAMDHIGFDRGIYEFYIRLYEDYIDKQRLEKMTGTRGLLYKLEFDARHQIRYDRKYHVKQIYKMKGSPCQYDFFDILQHHPAAKHRLKLRKARGKNQFSGTDTHYPVSHHELFKRLNDTIMSKSEDKLKQLAAKFDN